MAKGLNIIGLAMAGGAIIALYEGVLIVTGMEPFIKPDPIHDFLIGLIPSGGGNGGGGGGTASVTVDKTAYAAGDTINVTGAGFDPNETVGCRQTSAGVLVVAKDVTANANGGFTTTFTAGAAGGHITCTGRTSGKVGQALINVPATAYTQYY